MKNKTIGDDSADEVSGFGADSKPCESTRADNKIHAAMRLLAGKWQIEILWHLHQRPCRFGELRRAIPGITQHMLTTRLRVLETYGLITRTVFAEVPPRVVYELAGAGRDLRPVFEEIARWADAHMEPKSLERDDVPPSRLAPAPSSRE